MFGLLGLSKLSLSDAPNIEGCTIYNQIVFKWLSPENKFDGKTSQCFQTTSSTLILGENIKVQGYFYNSNTKAYTEITEESKSIGVSIQCTNFHLDDICVSSNYTAFFKVTNENDNAQPVYFYPIKTSFEGDNETTTHYYTTIKKFKLPLAISSEYTLNADGVLTKSDVRDLTIMIPKDKEYTVEWSGNNGKIKFPFLGEFSFKEYDTEEGSEKYSNGPHRVLVTGETKKGETVKYKASLKFTSGAPDNFPLFVGYVPNENKILTQYNIKLVGGLPVWAWVLIAIGIVLVIVIIIIAICCCCKKCCCSDKV